MNMKQCPVCGVRWLGDTPYWSYKNTPTTNANVREIVCKFAKKEGCANPERYANTPATDSWEKRRDGAQQMTDGIENEIKHLRME